MKKINLKKLIAAVLMTVCTFSVANAEFKDVAPSHWGYSKIMEFSERGFIKGYEDNTFKPDNTITRAEFICLINNFFGYTGNEKQISNFNDVDQNEWYAPAVNEAVVRGYISGYTDHTFRPYEPVKREEAITMLAKILNISDNEITKNDAEHLTKFSDYKDISDWALKSVYNYSIRNYISGYEDGTLRPQKDISRVEAIHLFRAIEQQIVIDRTPSKGGSSSGSRVTYYDITLNVGENGQVESDFSRIRSGKDVTITINPDTGYKFIVEDNGEDVTDKVSENVYIIKKVKADHIIKVMFEKIEEDQNPEEDHEQDTCTCEECIKELIELLEKIGNENLEILLERLENAKGDAETIKAEIKAWLEEQIENSECKEEIEALIDKIQQIDFKGITEEIIEELEGIISDEMWQDILDKVKEQVSDEDLEKLKDCLNKLKEEMNLSKERIEEIINEIIENHDCQKVEDIVNKLIDVLEDAKNIEELEELLKEYFENVSEEDIKKAIEELMDKYNTSAEELLEKIEQILDDKKAESLEEIKEKLQKIQEDKEKIEETIKEIIEELKDKAPTEEELKEIAEALLTKGEASLEDLKEKIKAELENNEDKWKEFLEELKDKITDNLPDDKEINDLYQKIENAIPEIEELTGVEFEELAQELGIDAEAISKVIEAINGNEELKEALLEKLKDKIAEVIVQELSNNKDVAKILNQIYSETGKDVVEILLYVNEKDATGIAAKIILSNTELSEILAAVDEEITEEQLKEIIDLVVENYGLVDFVKEADDRENAKELLTVALENADIIELTKAMTDTEAREIILKYFDIFELTEILDENGSDIIEDIWDNFSKEDLLEMLEKITDSEELKKITEIIAEKFGNDYSDDVTDIIDKTEETIKNFLGITTVNYDRNAENVTGSTASSKHIKGIASKLTENGFEREGYTFVGWAIESDATSVDYDDEEKVTSAEFNVETITLYAVWEANTYNISGGYLENGNSVSANVTTAKTDEVVELDVTVAPWYEVVEIKANDTVVESNEGVYSFVMPAKDVNITASFRYTYVAPTAHNITIDTEIENGTIAADKTAAVKDEKVVITTITPVSGYQLVKVVVNGNKIDAVLGEYSFVMPDEEVIISAEFEAINYNVIVDNTIENGNVKVSKNTANINDEITITVTPNEGYKLVADSLKANNGIVTITDNKFTMPAKDVTVTAEFEKGIYNITLNVVSDNGSAYVLPELDLSSLENLSDANYGDKIYVVCKADSDDYKAVVTIDNGTLNNGTSMAGYTVKTFTMPAEDVIVTVDFEKVPTYGITVSDNSNGKIIVVPNSDIKEGDTVVVTSVGNIKEYKTEYIPNDWGIKIPVKVPVLYQLKSITLTGDFGTETVELSNGSGSFEMPAGDVTITGKFE